MKAHTAKPSEKRIAVAMRKRWKKIMRYGPRASLPARSADRSATQKRGAERLHARDGARPRHSPTDSRRTGAPRRGNTVDRPGRQPPARDSRGPAPRRGAPPDETSLGHRH